MSRIPATHRPALLALALAAAVVALALALAGLSSIPLRTYAARVPDSGAVATVHAAHRVCEGPIRSPASARGVEVFGQAAGGAPSVAVTVLSGRRTIAAGHRAPGRGGREQPIRLDHPIPAGRPIHVCISASGGAFTVFGAGAQAPGVVARGVTPGMQFALVLTRPGTLLGSLSTAFSRAAIFRPSWVGGWTFWLLLALLVCTLPLAGVALIGALADTDGDESSRARDDSS